ncbi:MAG: protein TolR [Coxiellaceae bacterium]|nr:protein TolR [Coxiellaceae bacterium]
MNRRRNRKKPMAEINVVPYIDVMLVLLMIFMITAPLLTQGVHVNLPQASAKTLTPDNQLPIIVTVDKKGEYFLNIAKKPSKALNAAQLNDAVGIALGRAKQKNQKRDVYVRGDKAVDYGKVVNAMVLLQQAGAKDVGLITKPA